MTSFILRTEAGDDLGFLAFANHDGDWPPPGRSDCVFMYCHWTTIPDDSRALFVLDQKGQEFTAEITYSDAEMRVHISLASGWHFELQSGKEGNVWEARKEDERLRGTGQFL